MNNFRPATHGTSMLNRSGASTNATKQLSPLRASRYPTHGAPRWVREPTQTDANTPCPTKAPRSCNRLGQWAGEPPATVIFEKMESRCGCVYLHILATKTERDVPWIGGVGVGGGHRPADGRSTKKTRFRSAEWPGETRRRKSPPGQNQHLTHRTLAPTAQVATTLSRKPHIHSHRNVFF